MTEKGFMKELVVELGFERWQVEGRVLMGKDIPAEEMT